MIDETTDEAVVRQQLCDRDLSILEMERLRWKHQGAKEAAVHAQFGMSLTRYYQVVNGIIDRPEALEVDPVLVRRLQRLRADRQRQRSARRAG